MLKHPLACIFIYTSLFAMAQNPVPNSSFENWANSKPVSWTYSNQVIQTSPGHSGQYAVKGDSISVLRCFNPSGTGFPVTQTYGYLNFYYQFHKVADETLLAGAYILDSTGNHLNCDLVQLIQTGTDTFQSISIPFHVSNPNVAPADVEIYFHLESSNGLITPPSTSYFVIDDVSLSNSPLTSISESNTKTLDFTVSPNPADNSINITTGELHDADVTVYNTLGEALYRGKWNGTSRQLDINHFEQGLYIISINHDGVLASLKFQKY